MQTPSAMKWIVVLLVGGLAGVGMWVKRTPTGSGPAAPKGDRKVPVAIEVASTRDVPIILEGLGTVTPLSTVQVKSQVDGRLVSVPFKEGALVKAGEVLAQVDPRPFQVAVAQTQAVVTRDEALLRNAKVQLERQKQLREQHLVAEQAADDAAALVAQLEATVAGDRAANDTARLQLEYSRMVSPVDGVTGLRQIDPGNVVRASDTTSLVVVTQLDPIAVVFTLPQDELERVQRAMADKTLEVEAWSRDGRSRLGNGSLSVVDNQVNGATGTVKLKAIFSNKDKALWPNAFVKARLLVDEKKGALVIAANAIQRGPQGPFVYVATAENTAALRPVEVELIEGPIAVMRKGLEVGDRVIIDGQNQLKPGAPIDARVSGVVAEAAGKRP